MFPCKSARMNVHLFCFFSSLPAKTSSWQRPPVPGPLCPLSLHARSSWLDAGGGGGGAPHPHHYGRDKQEAQGFDFLSQRKMRWLGEKTERLLLIGAGSCRTGGADWSFRTNQGEQPAENRPPPPHHPEHTLPWGSSTGHVNKHHVAQYTIANLSIFIHFFSRQFSHWRAGRDESGQVEKRRSWRSRRA